MGISNFFVNEKAIIEVFDLRQIEESALGKLPGSNGKFATSSVYDVNAADNVLGSLSGNQLDEFDRIGSMKFFDDNQEERFFQSFKGINFDAMKKQFEVQFNPSDLQIEGYGGGRVATTAYNNPDDKSKESSSNIMMMPMPVYIKMSVKLLFDRMDPSDSFLSEKTNIAASEMTRFVAKNAVRSFKKSTKLTVQQEVEGLIAALRSPYTRCITFNWGDMSYEGILNRVASQYTMFNSAGEPVRAVVQLSLICADEGVNAHSLGSWQAAYDEAFGAGSNSLVSAGQRVGSIFNIGK
ncbi:MAG: hypothetical protein PUD20_08645 [bacterium]|nr:hypothetical protein [bacterium]